MSQRHATWRRAPASRPVIAWCVSVALRGLARLPFETLQRIGTWVGTLASWIPNEAQRTTRTNLLLAYPDLTPTERDRLTRASLVSTGRTLTELAAALVWSADDAIALVRETVGLEHLAAAVAGGRGVLVASPHMPSWEIGGLYTRARLGFATVYRPIDVRELETLFDRGRRRAPGRVLSANPAGLLATMRILRANGIVNLVIDQDPGLRAGVFAPFLGVLAHSSTLVPRLVNRTGARIVIGWLERLDDGRGFRAHFKPARDEAYVKDYERAAHALNADLEDIIRATPEQYLWSYKRFRIRPNGEPNPYSSDEGLRRAIVSRAAPAATTTEKRA